MTIFERNGITAEYHGGRYHVRHDETLRVCAHRQEAIATAKRLASTEIEPWDWKGNR